MFFADLHIHLLYGVDDGAEDESTMQKMLDAAYAGGTRVICATPHFHPGFFGDNREAADIAFTKLLQYAKKYSDLKLFFGNELRYSQSCLDWLNSEACKTLNGGRCVLLDFAENADAELIVTSALKLLNAGYAPILAHAERYEKFHRDMREICRLHDCGALIQIDGQSPFGGWGRGSKKRSRKIIKNCLADIIASDAHNVSDRPPQLDRCYGYVRNKCGEEYAEQIFWKNPMAVLSNSNIGKEPA